MATVALAEPINAAVHSDDLDRQDAIEELLTNCGCTVSCAFDGMPAFTAWPDRDVDLVVLDYSQSDATLGERIAELQQRMNAETRIVVLLPLLADIARDNNPYASHTYYLLRPRAVESLAELVRFMIITRGGT